MLKFRNFFEQNVFEETTGIKAFHASDHNFDNYDWSKLGQSTQSNLSGNHEWATNLANIGPWAHEKDISKKIGMKHSMAVEIGGKGKHYHSLDKLESSIRRHKGPINFRQKMLQKGFGHISVSDEEMGGKSYIGLSPEHFKIIK